MFVDSLLSITRVDFIRRFSALFGVRPQRLVCDLHPDFLSTRYAKDLAQEEEISLLQVQHHHAHMASVMAEHGLDGGARFLREAMRK